MTTHCGPLTDPTRGLRLLALVAVAAGAIAIGGSGADAASAGVSAEEDTSAPPAEAAVSVPAPGSPAALQDAADQGVVLSDYVPAFAAHRGRGQRVPLNNNCSDMNGCMWHYDNFEGTKSLAYPSQADQGWLSYGLNFLSAKNRFNNRKFLVGNFFIVTACLNPGDNRPNLSHVSDRFNVGGSGSSC